MAKTLTKEDIKAITKEVLSGVEKLLKNINKTETTNASELMTVEEVCTKLSLGKQTVYNLIRKNEIKSLKIGKKVYVKKSDLNNYINSKYQENEN